MDVDRNHLIDGDIFKELGKIEKEKYTSIPPELQTAAEKKLAGNSSAFVSKHSGGKLSKWAAQKRKEKRKSQKLARKRNR